MSVVSLVVAARVRNPYAHKMTAVSLCLSAVGFTTHCRSCQLAEIEAGAIAEVTGFFLSPFFFHYFSPVLVCDFESLRVCVRCTVDLKKKEKLG